MKVASRLFNRERRLPMQNETFVILVDMNSYHDRDESFFYIETSKVVQMDNLIRAFKSRLVVPVSILRTTSNTLR